MASVDGPSPAAVPPPEPPPDDEISSDEPGAEPAYEYGTPQHVPANYVSDAALLAWLQAKSSGQYGELEELMDASNARSKLIKDLSKLQEKLSDPTVDPADKLAELEKLCASYAGTEHAAEIEGILAPLRGKLEEYAEAVESLRKATENDQAEPGSNEENAVDDQHDSIWVERVKAQIAAQLGAITGNIDATIKDLEHDDQLALVQIQALMSEIRETAQLTSNIIANRSQTSDSIVGNIRA